MSLVTGLFWLVLLLNQRWSPPLRLQASHCSTFRIMCDVPSIAVFCNESIECFPGTVSKFFFRLLVTIPVAPIITGIIVHFRFHIRFISIHKLLYFNFFSASFCTTFLPAGIATSISLLLLLLLLLLLSLCALMSCDDVTFSEYVVLGNRMLTLDQTCRISLKLYLIINNDLWPFIADDWSCVQCCLCQHALLRPSRQILCQYRPETQACCYSHAH